MAAEELNLESEVAREVWVESRLWGGEAIVLMSEVAVTVPLVSRLTLEWAAE